MYFLNPASARLCLLKITGAARLVLHFFTGAEGLEPPVLVLETSGLPVNRRPYSSFYFFMWGVLLTGFAEFTDFQFILVRFFIFCRRIISILANRTL